LVSFNMSFLETSTFSPLANRLINSLFFPVSLPESMDSCTIPLALELFID
jgi:hypothetical protein